MIPSPWEFALLALGTFRVVRLIGWDSLTEKLREALTGYDDDAAPALGEITDLRKEDGGLVATIKPDAPPANPSNVWARRYPAWRVYLSTLIRCPWCQGFYVSVAVYLAWWALGDPVLAACVALGLSSAVGLLAKNLDP